MKVFIVFWSDSFDNWKVVKVFSSEEKAQDFIYENKGKGYWMLEEDVE